MNRIATLLLAFFLAVPAAAQRRRAVYPAAPPCAETVLAAPFLTYDLALDGDVLYFADDEGGVFRLSRNGGEPTRLVGLNDGTLVVSLAVDEQSVYFSTAAPDGFLASIYSVQKSGGRPALLASGVVTPFDLAIDEEFIYWNSIGTPEDEEFLPDGKIERMRKDGSARTTLASSLSYPLAIALDGPNVLFGETGLAMGNDSAGLRSVPKSGGVVTALIDDQPVLGIAATDTNIYIGAVDITAEAGTVSSLSKGTNTLTRLVSDAGLPIALRVIGNDLYYFLLSDIDTIRTVPTTGGTARIVKQADFATQEYAVDACAIFFATIDYDTFFGTIRRAPR